MIIKYNIDIQNEAIFNNINRITNQIFKLLPSREEGEDWQSPLKNLIIEIGGMTSLLNNHTILFCLLCKLESLQSLNKESDFLYFRKVIFECLGLCNELKEVLK